MWCHGSELLNWFTTYACIYKSMYIYILCIYIYISALYKVYNYRDFCEMGQHQPSFQYRKPHCRNQ